MQVMEIWLIKRQDVSLLSRGHRLGLAIWVGNIYSELTLHFL